MWKPLQTIIVPARPLLGALVGVVPAHASPAADADPPAAARAAKALAVFRSSCTSCHGPARQEGGLRLDTPAFIGQSGTEAVVLAGRPDRSRLLARIEGRGGLPRMSLGSAPLAPEQVLAVRAWVAVGAPRPAAGGKPTHWAYRAPARPAPPKAPAGWAVRNAIDRFVWARLRGARMRPSPEAPPRVLVRRLYLDLIGLPPSLRQVDAYLSDRHVDRYERLAARLLASPHYGERWARPWLDLARYADTNGYEKDGRRSMWRYRDWVIDALNRDMPYDRFTVQQIAGDMLPGATASQRIATGFHCNTMLNEEGGVDPEEQRWPTLVDRVATTGTVWLGTTLACAQCYDHKYDPFTQRDYYRFLAFFERQAVHRARSPAAARAAHVRVAEAEKGSARAEVDTTLVMTEAPGEGPPATFLRVQESYRNRAERVPAGVSEVLAHLAGAADDLCFLRSAHTDQFNHAPAQIFISSGTQLFGRPSMGSWVTYGLGSASQDLPGFVVLLSGDRNPDGGKSCWSSGFLPTVYQGVELRSSGDRVLFVSDPEGVDRASRKETIDTIYALNRAHLGEVDDLEIATRIAAYELAYAMQASVSGLMDMADEPAATHALYGVSPGRPSSANDCLLARRLVERGVRFVQQYHRWCDHHGTSAGDDLVSALPRLCRETDRAAAALVSDLIRRGLLQTTLAVWGGGFGRTSRNEGRDGSRFLGRDHRQRASAVWTAGGGAKAGALVGETDDVGYTVVRDPVHVHDLHATLLHLLGIDHTRLTYGFQGRQFRLTDVAGSLVTGAIA
ncbi:MAG: DUF1501 domain-containing protein [Chthonomonadales bacterium]|nr:DUF1501 domain-containing protein [Chthonomonadales bacterium]